MMSTALSHRIRPSARSIRAGGIALMAFGLASSAFAQTAINDCLASHGMALLGGHSAAVTPGNPVWLFGGPGGGEVLCDPTLGRTAESISQGNVGITSFVAGTGAYTTTGAIAVPTSQSNASGYFDGTYAYRFRVIPDDPTSTAPVTLEFVTRHRFGEIGIQASGPLGFVSNGFDATYQVFNFPADTLYWSWNTGTAPLIEHGYFDVVESVVVPVNTDLTFYAKISQSSSAAGRLSPASSGFGSMASMWTFEATTDDPATIEWAVETELGFDAPQLDVVPEPGLGGALASGIIGLSMLGSRRSRGSAAIAVLGTRN